MQPLWVLQLLRKRFTVLLWVPSRMHMPIMLLLWAQMPSPKGLTVLLLVPIVWPDPKTRLPLAMVPM